MVTLTCMTIRLNPSDLDFKNPNFQLGRPQAAVSSFVLIFCFIGMLQEMLIYFSINTNLFFKLLLHRITEKIFRIFYILQIL